MATGRTDRIDDGSSEPDVIELRTDAHVRQAFRSKDLRQALYDDGAVVMADCLLTLHGEDHRRRRRLENRLFRRETFERWERELLTPTIRHGLAPFLAAGRGDLLVIGYRCAMSLTASVAGVDHDPTDAEATDELYAMVRSFSEGATLVHSTRDRDEVRAEVRATMERFRDTRLAASIERRVALAPEDRPPDVLSTLLDNRDGLELAPDVLLREICFYLQAGAHSTANAFTHTVDKLFDAAAGDDAGATLRRWADDPAFLRSAVHESLRLDPASPVAWRTPVTEVVLGDGTVLPVGSRVVLDLAAANRDPAVWGADADRFVPGREISGPSAPWGHSFGGGMHACIGKELDGGTEPGASAELFGTVALMVAATLRAGARPDPEDPAELDSSSTRRHFSRYPVVFV